MLVKYCLQMYTLFYIHSTVNMDFKSKSNQNSALQPNAKHTKYHSNSLCLNFNDVVDWEKIDFRCI